MCHAQTCPEGYLKFTDPPVCGAICNDTQFARISDKSCVECDREVEGCSACMYDPKAFGSIICTECADESLTPTFDGKECSICEVNEFKISNDCFNCNVQSFGCDRCTRIGDQGVGGFKCESCIGELELIDGTCQCSESGSFINRRNEWDEDSTFCDSCSNVFEHCLECESDGSACTQCQVGLYIDEYGRCTEHACRSYDYAGLCSECNEKPGFEMKTQNDTCTAYCSDPFIETERGCELSCPDSYFIGADHECHECPPGCEECSDAMTCTKCFMGEFCDLQCSGDYPIHDYEKGMCVDGCESHSYLSNETTPGHNTPMCAYCDSTCQDCRQGQFEGDFGPTCYQCERMGDFYPYAFGEGCVTKCPAGYYENGPIPHCSACGNECETCTDTLTCIQCNDGFVTDEEGKCVNACPRGKYYNENEDCVDCDENCKDCSMDLLTNEVTCKVCERGFFLTPDGDCVLSCAEADLIQINHALCGHTCGSREGIDYSDNNKCRACETAGCESCYFSENGGIEVCESCGHPYFVQTDLRVNPPTVCVHEDECIEDFSPLIITEDNGQQFRKCERCDGYWDHTDKDEQPICEPCTYNFCRSCKWNFEGDYYECLQCAAETVYDPITHDCKGSCQPSVPFITYMPIENSFSDELTPTCVAQCHEGMSGDATENGLCKWCDIEDCDECVFINGEPYCNVCQNGLLNVDGQDCVDRCPIGYGNPPNTSRCDTCTKNQMSIRDGTCGECSDFDAECKTCFNDLTEDTDNPMCLECNDGFVVGDSGICELPVCEGETPLIALDESCVAECPEGEQVSANGIECELACPVENCSDCDFENGVCLACESGFTNIDDVCVDLEGNSIFGCAQYLDITTCETCEEGLVSNGAGCEEECELGFQWSSAFNLCEEIVVECGDKCHSCDLDGVCTLCKNDGVRFEGEADCFELCPYGSFTTINDQAHAICVECHSDCGECVGPNFDDCVSCRNGNHLTSDTFTMIGQLSNWQNIETLVINPTGECVEHCPERTGTDNDGKCIGCPMNCAYCAGNICITCDHEYTWNEDATGCVRDCAATFNECSECNHGLDECLTCNEGFNLHGSNTCKEECHLDWQWQDPDQAYECVPCDADCKTCDPTSGKCLTCNEPEVHVPSRGMIPDYQGGCKSWSCPLGCDTCTWNSLFEELQCDVCQDGWLLNAHGQCQQTTCLPNQYVGSGGCVDCDITCGKCNSVDGGCHTCADDTVHLTNGFCGPECGEAEILNSHGKCESCSENCSSCTLLDFNGAERQQCLSCDSGFFLDGDRGCVEACPDGKYADEALGWCVNCGCGCVTCEGSKDSCTSCDTGVMLNEDTMSCEMPPAYFPYGNLNGDSTGFTFYFPHAKYFYSKAQDFSEAYDASTNPYSIQTCRDGTLDQDWSAPEFETQKANLLAFYQAVMPNEDMVTALLNILDTATIEPANYGHIEEEAADTLKAIYSVSDSLFGMEDLIDIDTEPDTDSTTVPIFDEGTDICAELFTAIDGGDIDALLGAGRTCEIIIGDVMTQFTAEVVFGEGALFYNGMKLLTTDKFVERGNEYWQMKPQELIVENGEAIKPLRLEFGVNENIESDTPKGNCESGITLFLHNIEGLCGLNLLTFEIESVTDEEGNVLEDKMVIADEFNSSPQMKNLPGTECLPRFLCLSTMSSSCLREPLFTSRL